MFDQEQKMFFNNPAVRSKLLMYTRYIDDVFLLWGGDLETFEALMLEINNSTSPIKFTYSCDNNVANFLYVKVMLVDGVLQSEIYSKPTDRNTLLMASSHHPPALKRGLPTSQMMRVARITSDQTKVPQLLDEMISKFEHRVYDRQLLQTQKQKVLGQTVRKLSERMAAHRSAIKLTLKGKTVDQPVARHFKQAGHKLSDLSYFGIDHVPLTLRGGNREFSSQTMGGAMIESLTQYVSCKIYAHLEQPTKGEYICTRCEQMVALEAQEFVTQTEKFLDEYFTFNTTEGMSSAIVWEAHKASIRGHFISLAKAQKLKDIQAITDMERQIEALTIKHQQTPKRSIYRKLLAFKGQLYQILSAKAAKTMRWLHYKFYVKGDKADSLLAARLRASTSFDSATTKAEIVVIPKPDRDPTMCGNYRPISLLNSDLKLFAKTLANRLTGMISHLVHPDQWDCPIDLVPGKVPPRGRTYPLSLPETHSMEEYIKENLAKGFIRPSSSPAGAGFFFVKKKDGGLRPCIDYRGLNDITIKNRYPLPLITELFDRVSGATIFTKLDLRGAYNLIRIREGDEWKTAFNTRDGHYEYLVMPFGLSNAPAVFQHFVNEIFRDILYRHVVVYLDDILIFANDLEEHRFWVKEVLSRLRVNHLYCKLEKCVFEVQSIPFLGYIVSGSGLEMDPEKLQAIQNWPVPLTLKGVQRFLGFANYYRKFIRDFSTIVAPITAFTKKGANPSKWSEEAEFISRSYWWPTLKKDVLEFIASCPKCAQHKVSRQSPAGQLVPLSVPRRPWTHLSMDFITDLPMCNKFNTIWVVVDRFTKMAHFIPLTGLPSASKLAQVFIQEIFRLHGLPEEIISDRGVQFTAKFWRSLCQVLQVKLKFSTAYHPQTNGQTERVNQDLEAFLRIYVSSSQDDWVQ
ncbi:uncharacterized protein LOC134968692, partial [Pseudophryne corroboree]|uniref:uncharacterized protein LOC134968692 n=1 Tax=Pseudophryne corroboree TaxID=495146 RepID=UPI0030813648